MAPVALALLLVEERGKDKRIRPGFYLAAVEGSELLGFVFLLLSALPEEFDRCFVHLALAQKRRKEKA